MFWLSTIEPVTSAIPERTVDIWQAAQQFSCADMTAGPAGSDTPDQQTIFAVAFSVHLKYFRTDIRPPVIPPFLMGSSRRIQAAVFSFMAGVMPPMPMLGCSLL